MTGRDETEFSPTDFYEELRSSIDEQIDVQIENFKKELQMVAKKGGNKFVNNENIGECCDKLRNRMKNSYSENLKKFSIYADRNIFVTTPLIVQSAKGIPSKTKSALETVTEEVDTLKDLYNSRREELTQLSSGCRDGDALLKDMRRTLFTIRVGAQTLDEHNLQPISETIATLEQYQETMVALSSRAKDLKRQMSEYCEDEAAVKMLSPEANPEEVIATAGDADIKSLNQNLTK